MTDNDKLEMLVELYTRRISELQQQVADGQKALDEEKRLGAECYRILEDAFNRAGVPSSEHFPVHVGGGIHGRETFSSRKVDWLAAQIANLKTQQNNGNHWIR